MAYNGRVLMPASVETGKDKEGDWIWKASALIKLRRTPQEATQLASKNMVVIEDMNQSALPGTDVSNLHGANKYAQIGCDAAQKLLKATIDT